MNRVLATALLGLVTTLQGTAAAAQSTVLRTTGEPPPGFEAFFETQRTVVDVYYAGEFLTTTPANYDIDSMEFLDAGSLVAQIPDLIDPSTVAAALSGDLPVNTAALCSRGRSAADGCGRISPRVAGVIFDASRFRATLFVAPDQLRTRSPDVRRFLPPSDSEFSFLQNLSLAFSGSDAGDGNDYNVTSLSSVSYAESLLQVESSYGSDDTLRFDQAYARRDFEGRAVQGGLYRSRSQSIGFVREQELVGLRLESSLETRADRAFSGGTPIEVFLQTRARVEILQDGRLLDSRAYDAGNQILDTSNLPDGAYDIDIRIRESGGGDRIEQRFFVKSTRLPPADQALWLLEAGRIVDRNTNDTLPEDTGDWFGRAGRTWRVDDDTGVDLGIAAGLGDSLLEAGMFRVGRLGEFQASAFGSAQSDYGFATLARMQFELVRLTANYRHIETDDTAQDRLAGTSLRQASFNLSAPLRGGVLSLGMRRDERPGSDTRNAQTLSWDRTILRSTSGGLRLSFDISREDDDWVGLVSLNLDGRRGAVSAQLRPGARYDRLADGSSDFGSQTDGRMFWERQLEQGDLVRAGIVGTTGVQEDRIGTEGLYEGRFGSARAQIDRNFNDGDRTTWTGVVNTSVLSDGRSLSVGGRDRARSAALVQIDGDVPDARFEVLVDGHPSGIAPAGSVTPIHLRPWKTYDIRLRPVGSALVAWENRDEQITLYPGNIVRLHWQVNEIVVLLGRIVDGGGQGIEGARLDGAYGFAMTDVGGLFQAEVVKPASGAPIELIARRRGGERCVVRIDTTGMESRKGILRVGRLACAPEDEADQT